MLPNDYDKLLFNKLAYEFSVMSSGMIKTDLNLIDKKDYFYFSYKTKIWVYHAETKMDFIYYFGVNDKPNEINLDDARLILKINKNNKIYSNSLLFVKNNFYIAKDELLKNHPNLNFKGFEIKKLKSKTRTFEVIKLGEIKDAIMNLEKLVLAIPGPIKNSCKICGESILSKKIKQDNIINNIQKSHPDMCGECIEKIIACEFLNKISPYLNQHTQSLEVSKKNFGNDTAFEYCLNLAEKFNLLYYFGYDKSLFSINSDNIVLKTYSKCIDKDNLLIDDLIAIMGDQTDSKNVVDESLINEFINLKKRGMNNKKIINYLKIPESKIKMWCDEKNRKNKIYEEFYYYYTLTIYGIKSLNKEKQMKDVLEAISSGKTREEAARIAKIPLYKIGQWFEEGKSNFDKATVNFYNDLKQIEGNTSEDSSEKEYDEPKREIFDPILDKYSKTFNNSNINKSGIAWVKNESGSWYYERSINGVFIQIRDKTLEGLYNKVIKKGLVWGIRDYDKAKKYLNIPKGILLSYLEDDGADLIIKDESIFKPISKEFRSKFSSMNSSGIAWVNLTGGNTWAYNKQKNKKTVRIVDDDLYSLYLKVIDEGLPWGIRDYDRASKYLDIPEDLILKYSKELNDDFNQLDDNAVDDKGIYNPLSEEYESKFSGINKTGIAWTNYVGNNFIYSKRENGKEYRFTSHNIYGLYSEVIDAGLPWGIRDYDRASEYIDIPEEVILKYSGKYESETDDGDSENINSESIYRPLSKKYEERFSGMNESGIAWVNRMGTVWAYVQQKNKKVVRLVDGNLHSLYLRVIDKGLPWGIRDYNLASKYLDIPEDIILKYSNDEIDENSSSNNGKDLAVDEGIYQPISKEYEKGFSGMNESGIAWVNLMGTQWSYKKQKNNKIVQIADYDLYSLYLRVVDAGLPWGIRDYNRASKYLDIPEDVLSKYSNESEQGADNSDVDVIDDGIYKPFPKECEHLFKSAHMNKSGIAWVNMPGKKWEYNRSVNGKPIRLVSETLEDLYLQVIKNNLLWGIRDYNRAKNYLNIPEEILSKYSAEPEPDMIQDSTRKLKHDFNINSFKSNNLFNVVVTGLVDQEDLLDALNIFKDFKNFIKRINTTSINNSVDIFIEFSMDESAKSHFERFILDSGLNFSK